jgi:hypothetical protein
MFQISNGLSRQSSQDVASSRERFVALCFLCDDPLCACPRARLRHTHTSSFQDSLTSYFRTSSTHVVSNPHRGMSRS